MILWFWVYVFDSGSIHRIHYTAVTVVARQEPDFLIAQAHTHIFFFTRNPAHTYDTYDVGPCQIYRTRFH